MLLSSFFSFPVENQSHGIVANKGAAGALFKDLDTGELSFLPQLFLEYKTNFISVVTPNLNSPPHH